MWCKLLEIQRLIFHDGNPTTELAEQVLSLGVKVNGNSTRFYSHELGDLSVGYARMGVHKALTLCF